MNKDIAIDLLVTKYPAYADLRRENADVSGFCNELRDKILDDIDYVFNKADQIRKTIIEKYGPNMFYLSDYFEHVFHEKLLQLLLNVNTSNYVKNSYMFYLIIYISIIKYKMTLELDGMIQTNPILKNGPVFELINKRKASNIGMIHNTYQSLLQIDPQSEESAAIKNIITGNVI
jgi:hypothetical protein